MADQVTEAIASQARKAWVGDRIQVVKDKANVYDILRRKGVTLSQLTDDREEQIPCPFHGQDKSPSARVYPPTDEKPGGGVWCFVCQERWDVFGLWKKFSGNPDLPFMQVLQELEKEYHITPQGAPDIGYQAQRAPIRNESLEAFKSKWDLANNRLGWARDAYRAHPRGLQGFLLHGQALDKVYAAVDLRSMSPQDGMAVVDKVLEIIRTQEAHYNANRQTLGT